MSNFEEVQFPVDISVGSKGGPLYSTDVVILHSGHEKRNANWAAARAHYNVAYGVRTQVQLDTLIAFFRARQGRAIGFRFKDWTDYTATGQNIAVGDGSTTDFQLIKTYSSGSAVETRTVTKPVSGTTNIYVDSVLQAGGVSVDTTTGIVTFTVAPADSAVISANFEFDVPVRFDTDHFSAILDSYDGELVRDIPLIEVRI